MALAIPTILGLINESKVKKYSGFYTFAPTLSRDMCAQQDPSWTEMVPVGCVRATALGYVEMHRSILNNTLPYYAVTLGLQVVLTLILCVRYYLGENNKAEEAVVVEDDAEDDKANGDGIVEGRNEAEEAAVVKDNVEDDVEGDEEIVEEPAKVESYFVDEETPRSDAEGIVGNLRSGVSYQVKVQERRIKTRTSTQAA